VDWERPQHLFARRALAEQGWRHDVLITVRDGIIADVAARAQAPAEELAFDLLLPGISNVHSHAF
jgi:cytosine/adenosine deaminase-related metal-dependent hydrolase